MANIFTRKKNMKFLSAEGVSHLWEKIRERFDSKLDKIDPKDDSVIIHDNNIIGVQVSQKEGNIIDIVSDAGEEGLYAPPPPSKVSELDNDIGYLTTETDPTVPAWAKEQNKPSYTAQEVGAIDASLKGTANGVAELGADGKIPSAQLPSYVDDIVEYDSVNSFPVHGESGKIYVDLSTNISYRWSGSAYVRIASDIALGETESTAYRGDRGKAAYDHSQAKGSAFASGLYKITTNAEGHVTDASAVTKSDITDLGIPGSMPVVEDLINDNAGSGVTNKTWSANKIIGTIPTKVSDLQDDSGHYTKPAGGIPASDIAEGVIPDISGKADKSDTVLDTTLSRGRKANTNVGTGSLAFGNNVEASGIYSKATGNSTVASGSYANANGSQTVASGAYARTDGISTKADANAANASGMNTVANGAFSNVYGTYNVPDDYSTWQEWTANTEYEVGAKVKVSTIVNNELTYRGYICKTQNSDSTFDMSKWNRDVKMNYAVIVGNGTSNNDKSNAYTLDWDGNERLRGDVYVGADADGAGGNKLARVSEIPDVSGKLDAPLTPGTAGQVLTSDGNGGQSWENSTGVSVIAPVFSYQNSSLVCNMTFADVLSAVQNKACTSCIYVANQTNTMSASLYYYNSSVIVFNATTADTTPLIGAAIDDTITQVEITFNSDETCTVADKDVKSMSNAVALNYLDLTFPVTAGTMCLNGRSLYKAKQDIQAREPFTFAHWQFTRVATELESIGSQVIVSDTEPSESSNKLWVNTDPQQEFTIPTYAELQELSGAINVLQPTATSGDVGKFLKAKTVADGKVTEYEFGSGGGGTVTDVQVNGTSVVSSGVANIPAGNQNTLGVFMAGGGSYGIDLSSNKIIVAPAGDNHIKAGTDSYRPIAPARQHKSVFYGLAKAAGDSTQSSSSNAVGTYTADAKKAIRKMLGLPQEWELIADVTTTQDLETLEVITDTNGQAFELSEMFTRAILQPSTTGTKDYIKGATYAKIAGETFEWRSLSTLPFPSASGVGFFEYYHQLINGICRQEAKQGSGFSNSQNLQSLSFPEDAQSYPTTSLCGLRLQQYNSTSSLIPSGTRVMIYGKRII